MTSETAPRLIYSVSDLYAAICGELAEIRAALSRADQKAATLLSIVGVALAFTLTILTAVKISSRFGLVIVAFGGGCIGATVLGASAVLLIAAVRPDMSPTTAWPRLASVHGPDQILELLTSEDVDARNRRLAGIMQHLAQRAMRKLQYIKVATDLLLVSLVILMLSSVSFAVVA